MVHLNSSVVGVMTLGALSLPFVSEPWQQSAIGMDYRPIEHLLATHQWEAAAAETHHLIFEASLRNEYVTIGEDLLSQQAVDSFPCKDLETIDQLWQKYSQGRFGFSVQNQIRQQRALNPQELTPRQAAREWRRFTQRVGWQHWDDRQKSLESAKPIQQATDLPRGTLPLPMKSTGDFDDQAVTDDRPALFGLTFLQRAQQCRLADNAPRGLPQRLTRNGSKSPAQSRSAYRVRRRSSAIG